MKRLRILSKRLRSASEEIDCDDELSAEHLAAFETIGRAHAGIEQPDRRFVRVQWSRIARRASSIAALLVVGGLAVIWFGQAVNPVPSDDPRVRSSRVRDDSPQPKSTWVGVGEAVDRLVLRAAQLRSEGKLAAAIDSCRDARDACCTIPQLATRCAHAGFVKGSIELEAGNYVEAVDSLESALEVYERVELGDVDRPELFALLAESLWKAGRKYDAVTFLSRRRVNSNSSAKLTIQLLRYLDEDNRHEALAALVREYDGRITDAFAGEGADLNYVQRLFHTHVIDPELRAELERLRSRVDDLSSGLKDCATSLNEGKFELAISRATEVLQVLKQSREEDLSTLAKRFRQEVAALKTAMDSLDERRLLLVIGEAHRAREEYSESKVHLERAHAFGAEDSLAVDIGFALSRVLLEEFEVALSVGQRPPARNLTRAANYLSESLRVVPPDDAERRARLLMYRARYHAHSANGVALKRDVAESLGVYPEIEKHVELNAHRAKSFYYLARHTRPSDVNHREAIRRLHDLIILLERKRSRSAREIRLLGECIMFQGLCYYSMNRDRQDLAKAKTKLLQASRMGVETAESRAALKSLR